MQQQTQETELQQSVEVQFLQEQADRIEHLLSEDLIQEVLQITIKMQQVCENILSEEL